MKPEDLPPHCSRVRNFIDERGHRRVSHGPLHLQRHACARGDHRRHPVSLHFTASTAREEGPGGRRGGRIFATQHRPLSFSSSGGCCKIVKCMLTSLGVYDFQKWLNDLGVSATGIAIKEDRPTFPWQHETIRSLQGIQASCLSLAISGLECRSRTGRRQFGIVQPPRCTACGI